METKRIIDAENEYIWVVQEKTVAIRRLLLQSSRMLNEILRTELDSKRISKTALAQAVGISRAGLYKILAGVVLPKAATLEALLRELGVGVEEAAHIWRTFESERYATIRTARKEVRSARKMFVAMLLENVPCLTLPDRTGEAWEPDLWARTSLFDCPVFAEVKILDHFGLLGRAIFAKRKSIHGSFPDWKAWICVPDLTEADHRFNEDVLSLDLQVTILNIKDLREGIKVLETIANGDLVEDNAQDHIEDHINAD
jgi:transcriptional regulator with XRE-family HTH domain